MKSSGELKSRGVKLLPGKDNTNKLSLSKSFNFFFIVYFHLHRAYVLYCLSLASHHLVKDVSYSTRYCRSAVSFSFWWPISPGFKTKMDSARWRKWSFFSFGFIFPGFAQKSFSVLMNVIMNWPLSAQWSTRAVIVEAERPLACQMASAR